MINAGDLDRTVTIEQPVVTRDPALGSQSVTWATLATVRASVRESASATDTFLGGLVAAQARPTVIRMRWRADVDARCRVRHGDRVFVILGVAEIGRRVGLELVCKEWAHD